MIAIVYPQFYGVGGIARYLDSFLSNLPIDHPTIYLITGDEHRMDRQYPGVEIIHVPFSSSRLNLFLWGWRVRRLLTQLHDEKKVSLVNFHFPPLIPGLLLPRHIPMVLTAHTTYLGMSGQFYPERHFTSQWNGLSLAIKYWMEHRIIARAHTVISLTEQGRQEILAYGYSGPIVVIPNGVDVSLFTLDEGVKKDVDVLFCGRIEFRKGSRGMVELCRRLITIRPEIRICIVGYGDDDCWVRSQLAGYGKNVQMAGKVPFAEMVEFYNRSRIYVSTSYYEGLPGTCLEAMSMCLPAVGWNFSFYHGLIVNNKTGLLAAPNDFEGIVSQVHFLLENPTVAEEMGHNARSLLESDYDWKGLARKVLAMFDRALA